MRKYFSRFWAWYERHYELNLKISALLFFWQIIHLIWLSIVVVLPRALNYTSPDLPKWFNLVVALVDYTEIPALFSISIIYLFELKKKWSWKNFWLLTFLNSQWLHLFWITDEIVLDAFTSKLSVALPLWLAWVAIIIDYLELPVMYDTLKKYLALKKKPST